MSEKTDLQIDANSDRCDDKVTDSVPVRGFKVGDEVICNVGGRGVVIEDSHSDKYPIRVLFEKKDYQFYETYTKNGRMYLGDDNDGEHIRHLTKLEKALR